MSVIGARFSRLEDQAFVVFNDVPKTSMVQKGEGCHAVPLPRVSLPLSDCQGQKLSAGVFHRNKGPSGGLQATSDGTK
ncbi:hypothetical protein ACUN8C_11830 [Kushneria sp. Sum13]|uniref:hypothetical protein n=1 Tax=Kushneria sp. Sum13 TaxID=3459196 RepID=UPI004045418C